MTDRYYLDSCIWRDYFENRSDKFRPLGDWAFRLLRKAILDSALIIYSELVEDELKIAYSEEEISEIFSVVPEEILLKVDISKAQLTEAIQFSKKTNFPVKDMLHAILSRDNGAILVTRDKHFSELEKDIVIMKPEDLI